MSNKTLVNFYIPEPMKEHMKSVCEDLGLTQTAFILTSIEPRLRLHASRQTHRETPGVRHSHMLPDFFSTSDAEIVNNDW